MSGSDSPVIFQHEDSSKLRLSHGVMEGNGAYNQHSRSQAAGAALAIPLLERAIQKMVPQCEDQPFVIVDYGSSQGKNSLRPMRIAIRSLRARIGPMRPVVVFHIDQPSNDFNSLFEVLSSDSDRYVLDQANVFPCAIGRSFYEQVLPDESVHLGWSSYAAMWLRRIPSLIPGHFWSWRSTGAARAAFERQAAEDWEAFLSLRAREMSPGARLVVVVPAPPDTEAAGVASLMDHANAVLSEMVNDGTITATERAEMVLGAHPRRMTTLLGPFAKDGRFQKLVVEDQEECVLPDAAWAEYQEDGDEEAFALKKALFFRSTAMPSLASALKRVREGDQETLRFFADRLQDGLTRRLIRDPSPADILVQIIVFAKSA